MSTESIGNEVINTDIEIVDALAKEDVKPVTLSDLRESGLSPTEVVMAEKLGMAVKDGGGEVENKSKKEDQKNGKGEKAGEEVKGKEGREKDDDVNERFRILSSGKSPEQIISEVTESGGSLTEAQEKILIASLTQNGKTLYWAQKKERQKRQKVEQDATEKLKAKDIEIAELRAKVEADQKIRSKRKEVDPLGLHDDEETEESEKPKVDIPEDEKPLNRKDLEEIEAEKKKKLEEAQEARYARASEIKEALEFQQLEAKERYEDFDASLDSAREILKAVNEGSLDKMFADPKQRSRIIRKVQEIHSAYANADTFGEGDFNAADMTYELGKEHPEFGKPSFTDENDEGVHPEKSERVLKNASRRGSSAALNGGGSRRVALDDLTMEQASRLSIEEFSKLPKHIREKLLGKA